MSETARMLARQLLAAMAALTAVLPQGVPGVFKAGILSRDPYDMCDGLYVPGEREWYMIDNFGSFALGDTVVGTAAIEQQCVCNDYNGYGCLHENTIENWRNLDLGCGLVLADPEYGCKGFRSPIYGDFTLRTNVGFGDGDSAHVWGNADLEECVMIPECGFGYCLNVTRAAACPDSNTTTRNSTWGGLRSLFR